MTKNEKLSGNSDAKKVEDSYRRVCACCGKEYFVRSVNEGGLCPECKDLPGVRREVERVKRAHKRARAAGVEATLTLTQWRATIEHFEGLCAYCQERPFAVLGYFIPLDAGGGATWDNCVPTCRSCNSRKRGKNPQDGPLAGWPDERIEKVRRYLESRQGRE
jgi:5-methylcytosine-specific restriction endonuclease McrA